MNIELMETIRPLLSQSSAYEMGQDVGYWVFTAIMLAGIVGGIARCIVVAGRPSASTKALSSLIILLGLFGLSIVLTWLMRGAAPTASLAPLYGLLGLLVMAGMIASIVLAILGLIECVSHKQVYQTGKGAAITALVINGVFVLFIVVGIFSRMGPSKGEQTRTKFLESFSAAPVTFSNLNFRLAPPGRPWTQIDVRSINANATFGMIRTGPRAYFMMIAEVVGEESELNAEAYGEIVRASIRSRGESVRPLTERHVTRGWLDGLEMEEEARLSTYNVHYFHRLIVTNGYAYQLCLWGDQKDQEAIRRDAERFFAGFSLLDIARLGGSTNRLAHHSEAHHFELTLPPGWHDTANREKILPHADFMASHVQGSIFAVVPFDLRHEEINDDALISALLNCMDFKYPSDEIVGESRTAHQWGTIFRFECTRKVDENTFDYSLVLIRGARYAHFLTTWSQSSKTNAVNVREAALKSFRPLPVPEDSESLDRLSLSQRKTQSHFWNELGLNYHRQNQFEKSARLFALAGECSPEIGIYLANQLQALDTLNQHAEALALLERRLPQIKNPPPTLRAEQAALQDKLGSPEASATYAKLFESGFRSDSDFTAYLSLLSEENKLDQALSEAERYLSKGDSVSVRLSQAALLRRDKQFDRSIELLKTAQKRWPFSSEITLSLGESFVQGGSMKEAGELADQLLRGGSDSANGHYLKGRIAMANKTYADAKASFEKALSKEPGNARIQIYLAQVSGLLGEGANTDIKQPIVPVDFPKSLLQPPATRPASSLGQGAHRVKRVVAHSFVAGKSFKTTEYDVIHVDDRSGVGDLSTLQFPFDPLGESIFVNSLEVKDTNGTVISTGKLADYYVLDAGDRLVSQRKVLNVPVPNLQPGREIQVMVTRQMFGSASNFPYTQHFFSSRWPVQESVLIAVGDTKRIRYKSSASLEPRKIQDGLCWTVTNPPTARWEPLQPSASEFLPFVRLGDTRTTWDQETADYEKLLQDHLKLTGSVRELASNLVSRLTNSEAKVALLSRFVQSNLTYKPIEFGRRALVPQTANEILRNRYGDCKDHSLLLVQLAEAVGISSRLALVNSAHAVERELPSLDQFDHVIAYFPKLRGGLFVDCTDKGSDLTQGAPLGLGGKDALILDQPFRFVSIPDQRSLTSRVVSQRTVALSNRTDFTVAESLKLTGPIAAVLRSWLRETDPSVRIRLLQAQYGLTADIDKLEIRNLEQPDQPLELEIAYALRGQVQSFDNRLVGQIPCLFERTYLALAPITPRLTPMQLTVPLSFESKVEFASPSGYSVAPLKTADQPHVDRFARWESSVTSGTNQLTVQWKAERKVGTFPASEYITCRSALDTAIGALGRTVVLTRNEL